VFQDKHVTQETKTVQYTDIRVASQAVKCSETAGRLAATESLEHLISALGAAHVLHYINVRYLLTYLLVSHSNPNKFFSGRWGPDLA